MPRNLPLMSVRSAVPVSPISVRIMTGSALPAPPPWQFRRQNGGLFVVASEATLTITRHCQRLEEMPEAGGILLGRVILHAPRVVVDAVTEPSRWDRWTRYTFFRAKEPAQRAINRAWDTSDRKRNYLGDWHTHPEDDPTPSAVDIGEWRRLARTAMFEQNMLFFLIAGRVHVRAWEVTRGNDDVRPLVAI